MSVPLVRTLVLYFAVICAVRLMGKRQLGEMDPAELVVTILVSDLAAVPMQDLGIPLFFGLVPIAALVTLEVLLSILSLKSRFFRRLLNGQPAIIIRKGQLDLSKLRQLRLTTEDLVVALRKQSVASVSDVKYGVIEPGRLADHRALPAAAAGHGGNAVPSRQRIPDSRSSSSRTDSWSSARSVCCGSTGTPLSTGSGTEGCAPRRSF